MTFTRSSTLNELPTVNELYAGASFSSIDERCIAGRTFFFSACESRPEEEERVIGLSTTDSNIVCIIYYFLPMGNCMTYIDRGTS